MIVRLGDEFEGVSIDSSGGRLSSLTLAGKERLLTSPTTRTVDPTLGWGCYLMAPFVGRLSEGRVRWGDRAARITTNFGRHAIHGVTYDVEWAVTAGSDSAVLTCELDPSRWPFRGSVAQRIAFGPGRLSLEAEILAADAMPAALGWHPWFRRGSGDVAVEVASDRVLRTTEELIPTGQLAAVDDVTDLRGGPGLRDRRLDHCYASASGPLVLKWADLVLEMAIGGPVSTVVVYSPRFALCVEPMTAWPDAIRLAAQGCDETGLASLAPGERLVARTEWTWQPRDDGGR
jgi:aldose 1-epimerase